MHFHRMTIQAVAVTVATVGLLVSCAQSEPAAAPAPAPAPSVTATTAAATHAPGTHAPAPGAPAASRPAAATAPAAEGAIPGIEPVNCGKVDQLGRQADLIADSTPGGRVGCTEAFTVIDEYFRDAPTEAEGSARRLVVRGWECLADNGAQGSGSILCSKEDGRTFHTQF